MVAPQEQYHILSVKRAVRLLNLFADHGPALGVSEIAKLMNVHKSVAHKLLVTLESEDWIYKNDTTEKYALGLKPLRLCTLVPNRFNIRSIARTIMEELVAKADETATLTILAPGYKEGICIDKVECTHSIRMTTEIGSRIPLHAGATGLILAAHMDADKIEELLDGALPRYTENTIVAPDKLRACLNTIREQGFAVSASQVDQGLVGIAAPVFNEKGKLAAGLSISGPEYRFQPDEKIKHLVELVIKSARRITENLLVAGMETIS